MGRMSLRATIRAPVRYGDDVVDPKNAALYKSIRASREENNDRRGSPSPLPFAHRRPSSPKPTSTPFDPTLPPAAFPSLPFGPKPAQQPAEQFAEHEGEANQSDEDVDESDDPLNLLPWNQLENLRSSNSEHNVTYVTNMENTAPSPKNGTRVFEDSDLEEPIDDSENLGAKIVQNIKKEANCKQLLDKLDLTDEDVSKYKAYLSTRVQQDRRENLRLAEMRFIQLQHLLAFDNSDIKNHKVPLQLVLRQVSKKAQDSLKDTISGSVHVNLCQSVDVLVARQFLLRRGLSKAFAGEWGHGMVELQESVEHEHDEPEIFQWKEDLTGKCEIELQQISNRTRYSSPPDTRAETTWTRELKGEKGPGGVQYVNPRDLYLQDPETNVPVHRSNALSRGHPSNWRPPSDRGLERVSPSFRAFVRPPQQSPKGEPLSFSPDKINDSNGGLRLEVSAGGRAVVRHRIINKGIPYEHALPSIEQTESLEQTETIPEYVQTTPSRAPARHEEMIDEPVGDGTSSMTFPYVSAALEKPSPPTTKVPLMRVLAPSWKVFAMDHTIAQRRFEAAINEAHLESIQAREKAREAREAREAENETRTQNLPHVNRMAARSMSPQCAENEKNAMSAVRYAPLIEGTPNKLDDFFLETGESFPPLNPVEDGEPLDESWLSEWRCTCGLDSELGLSDHHEPSDCLDLEAKETTSSVAGTEHEPGDKTHVYEESQTEELTDDQEKQVVRGSKIEDSEGVDGGDGVLDEVILIQIY
ncbi:hypothetical protein N7468_002513 [Penicillium chermesinum]|uniref:Uncharacterized protein n=1 Tax=Penicillium chermesinum TaxID=63820 RepID=A0A9W9PIT0_9EURO|nr:uncharacterized protein N7468_002513 [Penicillium chermesinum]KAJ5247530.1 hypothetical protein N7468_002513 [Penicillium chermesinum]